MRKSSIPVSVGAHRRSASSSRLSTQNIPSSAPRPRRSSSLQRQSSVHGRPSFLARHGQSNGRPSRGSGYSSIGEVRIVKDVRPLSDKDFQSESVTRLVEFLESAGYPQSISAQTFVNLTKNDFSRIFAFMYNIFDPRFRGLSPSSKIEDEVPKLLKNLRYPFNVSRSTLMTMGARHSWPAVLGILTWMADLSSHDFEHILTSYTKYLNNEPDGETLASILGESENAEDVKEVEQAISKLQDEYIEVKQKFDMASEEWHQLEEDGQQYEKAKMEGIAYIQEMRARIADKQETRALLERKLEELALKRQQLDEEIDKVKENFEAQQLYAKDNEELSKQIEIVHELITNEEKRLDELSHQIWNKETTLKHLSGEFAGGVCHFNTKLQSLQSALASARENPTKEYLGQWINFECVNRMPNIEIQTTSTREQFMLIRNIKEDIEAQLDQWQKCLGIAEHMVGNEQQNFKETVLNQKEFEHKLDWCRNQWLSTINVLKSQLKEIKKESSALQKQSESLVDQITTARTDIQLLETKIETADESKKQVAISLEKAKEKYKAQCQESMAFLKQLSDSNKSIKEKAEEQLSAISKKQKSCYEYLRKLQ